MTEKLQNKVAIVTGAARGNGKGIARAMAKAGATVVLWDILPSVAETAKNMSTSGQRAVSYIVDITDVYRINQVVNEIIQEFERVDILVNNAGIGIFSPFVETTEKLRDKIFDVNLKGPWNCTKAVMPVMITQKYGKVINIASVTGPRVSAPGLTAYSAAKAGLCGFTRALALEVAGFGITVNAILPGFVDTPMLRGASKDLGIDEADLVKMLAASVPMKRLGTIDEIGDLAVFLASEASKYITGQEIVFDGGNIIQETRSDG